jgi:hypothetical protein
MQACDRHPRHQPCRKERDEAFLLDDRMQLREPAAPQHPCLKRSATDRPSQREGGEAAQHGAPDGDRDTARRPEGQFACGGQERAREHRGRQERPGCEGDDRGRETQFENHGAQLGRRVRKEQCPCGKGESDDHDQAGQTP